MTDPIARPKMTAIGVNSDCGPEDEPANGLQWAGSLREMNRAILDERGTPPATYEVHCTLVQDVSAAEATREYSMAQDTLRDQIRSQNF